MQIRENVVFFVECVFDNNLYLPSNSKLFGKFHNLRQESWLTEVKNLADVWEIATEPTAAVCLVADAIQETFAVSLSINHTRTLLSYKM